MKLKELYGILFTEYPGHLGFAPAVLAIAIGVGVCATVLYGGVILGKAAIAHTPATESSHS
jgi:hypothetical protein